MILIELPEIYDCGGKVSVNDKWLIIFKVRNPKTGKLERFRMAKGINKFHTYHERMQAAEKMKQLWSDKLKAGWTPFTDQNIIYDDNLQYQTLIKNYRKAVSKNGTFRFYASKYIDFRKNEIDPNTVITYRSKLRLFNAWLDGRQMGEADVSAITQEVLLEFMFFIIETRKLSKSSVDNYRIILEAVFNYVRKERKQFPNPCFDLPGTKRINDSAAYPIHESDIPILKRKILKTDPQLWLAICFEYYCFLRPREEIRFLKIGDIDFGRSRVVVKYENAKKGQRIVTIPTVFMNKIREVYKLQMYDRDYYVIGAGGEPGKKHLCINDLTDRFRKVRIALKMPSQYKLYSWKHTGNVRADDAGIPRNELQGQNGHTSMVTTEIYMKNKKGNTSKSIIENFPEI
jgi:integrase